MSASARWDGIGHVEKRRAPSESMQFVRTTDDCTFRGWIDEDVAYTGPER